jgi:hypothetical protein
MKDGGFLPAGARRFLVGVLLFLAGCSGGGSDSSPAIPADLSLDIAALYSVVDTVTVLVSHEPGAEPFTGTVQAGLPTWSVLKSNIDALFGGRDIEPEVYVPETLSEMDQLPAQGQDTWTPEDIVALARDTWSPAPSSYETEFFVFFLKGYFDNQGTPDERIIGVSIVGTPVIAIFKDVVLSPGNPSRVSLYVEQATLVHEFGHVMGLVGNGVPMVRDHLDPEHPRHCSSSDCVMYWLNEGAADMMRFAGQALESGSAVMFCELCLDDARSFDP